MKAFSGQSFRKFTVRFITQTYNAQIIKVDFL